MDELVVVGVCLFLNAIFAAFEMAFVSVPKFELRAIARKGNKNAQVLLKLRDNPERTLSVIQIGITLVGALAAAVGGAGASETLEPYFARQFGFSERAAEVLSVVLVVVPLTYLSVVIGELVPKSIALRSPLKIVLSGSRILLIADRCLSPVISLLELSTRAVLSVFFPKQRRPTEPVSQAVIEIDSMSPTHQRFMLNMANIEKKKVKEIMVPWEQVDHLEESDSIRDVATTILALGHTRLPVLKEERIVGLLHAKEFMAYRESGETRWQSLLRPLLALKPTDSALGVLRLMQERRSYLCVVYSGEGERLGIVTMEDIIEEIVGDIHDEDEDETP